MSIAIVTLRTFTQGDLHMYLILLLSSAHSISTLVMGKLGSMLFSTYLMQS